MLQPLQAWLKIRDSDIRCRMPVPTPESAYMSSIHPYISTSPCGARRAQVRCLGYKIPLAAYILLRHQLKGNSCCAWPPGRAPTTRFPKRSSFSRLPWQQSRATGCFLLRSVDVAAHGCSQSWPVRMQESMNRGPHSLMEEFQFWIPQSCK